MAALFSLSMITEKLPFFCYTKPGRLFFAKAVRECNSNHPYVLIFTGHQLSKTGKDAFY